MTLLYEFHAYWCYVIKRHGELIVIIQAWFLKFDKFDTSDAETIIFWENKD